MWDEVKTILKWGIPAIVLVAGLGTLAWMSTIEARMVHAVADEIEDMNRSAARSRQASLEATQHLEDGDVEGYQAVMDEEHDARLGDWERVQRRFGDREVENADALMPSRMPDGDAADMAPGLGTSMWLAAGLAFGGGLLVFLGVGFVAFRMLGSSGGEDDYDGTLEVPEELR